MKDKIKSDGAHQAMLSDIKEIQVKLISSNKKSQRKQKECEAIQSFLQSISSTATLPPYVKGETYSSVRGVFNQIVITCAVLVLAAGAGHPIGFSAVALPQLREENSTMRIDDEMGSWIASVHSAATPVGSIISGPIMEAIGRRRTLQVSSPPLIIGWILISTATNHAILLLGRIVCGVAVGVLGAPSQVYIGEISEPRLRGLLIGTPFVAYSFGVLYVYALGGTLPWRFVAYLCIVLPCLAFTVLCFAPESPTWLARRGRFHEAMAAMARLRGDGDTAHHELHELINAREKEKARGEDNISFFSAVFCMPVLKPLLLINIFNILQILSGSYVVIFYAIDIVDKTGGTLASIMVANISAFIRFGISLMACLLFLKFTHRSLVIISGLGAAVSTFALTFILAQGPNTGNIVPILILVYVGFNSLGFFLLPGLMIGELLPTKIRGICGGYIFGLFHFAIFGFAKVYPIVENNVGMPGIFIIFGTSATLATIVLFLLLPETKDKTLTQIEEYYQKPNVLWMTRHKWDGSSQRV